MNNKKKVEFFKFGIDPIPNWFVYKIAKKEITIDLIDGKNPYKKQMIANIRSGRKYKGIAQNVSINIGDIIHYYDGNMYSYQKIN